MPTFCILMRSTIFYYTTKSGGRSLKSYILNIQSPLLIYRRAFFSSVPTKRAIFTNCRCCCARHPSRQRRCAAGCVARTVLHNIISSPKGQFVTLRHHTNSSGFFLSTFSAKATCENPETRVFGFLTRVFFQSLCFDNSHAISFNTPGFI